jgi:hypothetical protein
VIALKATRHEFEVYDESGYRFRVVAEYDPESGWSASVVLSTFGINEANASIQHLREPLRRLLQLLDEEAMPAPAP